MQRNKRNLIRKRGGSYYENFCVNGHRYRAALNKTDWREASEEAQKRLALARNAKYSPSTAPWAKRTLAEVIPLYLESRQNRVSESTTRMERDHLKSVEAKLGKKRLKDITAADIEKYQTDRKAEKVSISAPAIPGSNERQLTYTDRNISNRTVNLEVAVLRKTMKKAKLWYRVADDIKPLPERSHVGRALSPDQKGALIVTAHKKPGWENARLAMTLALNTTMRGCEIKGLQWRDVDFIEREVTVRRSKTDAGERVITLNADAWQAILELRERAKKLFGDNLSLDWYIFPHAEGNSQPDPSKPMAGWRTAWRKLTAEAGLPGLRFHDMRHHAITELAESPASDGTIMAIAGHVDPKMLRHYSHIRKQAMREALDRLASRPSVPSGGSLGGVTSQNHVTKAILDGENNSQVAENIGRDGRI